MSVVTEGLDGRSSVASQDADPVVGSSLLQRWRSFLEEPVDGASLAVFRMCFAACMVMNFVFFNNKFFSDIAEPRFHFSFIAGMPVPSLTEMQLLLPAMTVMSVLIGVGLCYRPACALFFLSYTYLFLCEKMIYQNHAYLTCLLSLWLFLAPANRVWALDNIKGKLPPTVPRWSVLIFKLQISIVYFFAGITKLNPEWLRGQPQALMLAERATLPVIGPIISQPWFTPVVTFGGITVDLSMGFLLFARRTFLPAALVALSFHLMNSQLFQIDFFPWLMIATIGLYAPYNWPRRVLSALGIVKQPVAADVAQPHIEETATLEPTAGVSGGTADSVGNPIWKQVWQRRMNTAVLVFFHAYLLVQVTVPLRRFLYQGDMNWTNQAHRFCWSMLARRMTPRRFQMTATNPATGQTGLVNCGRFLTLRQVMKMAIMPDLTLQFSRYIADRLERKWGVRPIIHVETAVRMNDHPVQPLIDPDVDLASIKPSLANADWILPLRQ